MKCERKNCKNIADNKKWLITTGKNWSQIEFVRDLWYCDKHIPKHLR